MNKMELITILLKTAHIFSIKKRSGFALADLNKSKEPMVTSGTKFICSLSLIIKTIAIGNACQVGIVLMNTTWPIVQLSTAFPNVRINMLMKHT